MSTPSNLSPVNSPAESPLEHEMRFMRELQESFDAEMKLGLSTDQQKTEALSSIQSFIFVSIPSALGNSPVQSRLNYVWHTFIETAKHLDKSDNFQDKLFCLLLWTQEFDSIHKTLHQTETTAPAWESYGFANSLHASWEQLVTTDAVSHQCNLASFSAKALYHGVDRTALGQTALWFLRETLETDDEQKTVALLPAALIWLGGCKHRLLAFSVTNQSYNEESTSHLVAPGALARAADINEHGFSLKRWLFWRRRLQDLSHSADAAVAKLAKDGFVCMIRSGREMAFDVPGESKFEEKLHAVMFEELKSSGKGSVDIGDIDVNVDWVD